MLYGGTGKGRSSFKGLKVESTSDEKSPGGKGNSLPAIQPFLKWPGGKRWLVPELINIVKDYDYVTYREPFLGGGALFFALRPKQAVLSDLNPDLINVYRQVKSRAKDLLEQLRTLPINEATYYGLRKSCPVSPLHRAVRFIYLNRTAFGGMYRLNQKGEFNVPFGGGERTTSLLLKNDFLMSSARALRGAKLHTGDFEQLLSEASKGDMVYCDPTYTVAHNNNGFIRYNERNFSWTDQKRLSRSCRSAAGRGAFVIVSNAYHREVLELFSPPQYIAVTRTSRLCPKVNHRRSVREYVFIFPPSGLCKL